MLCYEKVQEVGPGLSGSRRDAKQIQAELACWQMHLCPSNAMRYSQDPVLVLWGEPGGGVGVWGFELGVSAPVRIEDKLRNGLSVKDSPGPASLRLCSERSLTPMGEIEATAKICPSCHQQGVEENNFKLS